MASLHPTCKWLSSKSQAAPLDYVLQKSRKKCQVTFGNQAIVPYPSKMCFRCVGWNLSLNDGTFCTLECVYVFPSSPSFMEKSNYFKAFPAGTSPALHRTHVWMVLKAKTCFLRLTIIAGEEEKANVCMHIVIYCHKVRRPPFVTILRARGERWSGGCHHSAPKWLQCWAWSVYGRKGQARAVSYVPARAHFA